MDKIQIDKFSECKKQPLRKHGIFVSSIKISQLTTANDEAKVTIKVFARTKTGKLWRFQASSRAVPVCVIQ